MSDQSDSANGDDNRPNSESVKKSGQECQDDPEIIEFFDSCLKSSESRLVDLLKRKTLVDLINGRDRNGRTLLHYCAECTGILCAQLLIQSRPHSIINQDNDGYTILHLAVINGNTSMVTYLTSSVKSYVPSEQLFTQFLNAGDTEGHTAFHWATVCNELSCLDILYSSGASASLPDIYGAHPVHYASQMTAPSNSINRDVRIGLKVLRKILSYQKVDPNCRDKDGRTPLLWAASSGSSEAIMMLVNSGADVSSSDKDGLTALHCASSRGHVESVEALLNMCGAQIDVIDSIGCSPLYYAVTLGHADCTQLLLVSGAEPNLQDLKGRTAAHCGAAKGQFETIKILASHGANLWCRNVRGDLPLHEAIKSGRKELVRWLLQQLPSAINTTNSIGRSPLHIAAADNNVEMCKVLIDCGSEINPLMKSKGNLMTPLDCALQKNYRSCAKFLLLHEALPASRLDLNSRSLNQKRSSSRIPGKGHISQNTNSRSKSRSDSQDNRYSSVNSNSQSGNSEFGQKLTNIESVESHHDDGRTRTSIAKRKVAIYRNNGSSPDYSYSTSRSLSSEFQSQSIITNVYVNTVSKHKMAPLKRIKRKMKLSATDSSQSSSLLNDNQSLDESDRNVKRAEIKRKGLISLSSSDTNKSTNRAKVKTRETIENNEGVKSRKLKSSLVIGDNVNDREQLKSQLLDRAISKRGQINKKRSLIGKTIVKHPHASDVDLSVIVTEKVDNGNDDNGTFNTQKNEINDVKDNLLGKSESNQSINDSNEDEDENNNKETPGNLSEAAYSEESFVNYNQDINESATGSLDSIASIADHEIPIVGSDDSSADNINNNRKVTPNNQDLKENDRNKQKQAMNELHDNRTSRIMNCDFNPEDGTPNEEERISKINDNCKADSKCDSKLHSESRCSHRFHHRPVPITGPLDLSHVTAKVDTRGLDLARRPQSEAKPTKEQIQTEKNEMMAAVERSLRKYQLERKIFQELQDLKRCQIRSGRNNEPVLVKRLVEKFRKEVKSPGMLDFNDSYSYRSYERFLYDQLRKLSSSNQGKVLPIIKSVSDENLALQFMKTHSDHSSQFDENFIRNNNNNHIKDNHHHDNYNKFNRIHSSNQGLGQKSVSAMSTFGQSKLKKDLHSSFNYNNQQSKKSHAINEKDSVKIKTENNGSDINSGEITSINNSNVIISNNNSMDSKNSTIKNEEKVIKKFDNQLSWKENKSTIAELKHGATFRKVIKEPNIRPNHFSTKREPSVERIKASNQTPSEANPLVVIDSSSDSGSLNKSSTNKVINLKDLAKDKKLNVKGSKKDQSDNQREKINEKQNIINRPSSKSTIKEIRRTTAKHEQYKSLRGSHKRNCLKSSDANFKPYVEAAVNRPKFKRCKSSIPSRFKVNVPVELIEKRWKMIKESERRKSAEQSKKEPSDEQSAENADQLEFKLLYEINRSSRNNSADEYDYYNEVDDDEVDQYPVHSRSGGRDDYSEHGSEYEDDEEDSDYYDEHRFNHYLKRTLSEPALIPHDLKV